MAASLKFYLLRQTAIQRQISQVSSRVYHDYRSVGKYDEPGEDSLYEKGEKRSDRYINIPQKVRPHPEKQKAGQFELDPPKGKVHDRKPFPMRLKAGKKYKWCVCGYSRNQPLCDGRHKSLHHNLSNRNNSFPLHHPVTFSVKEDGRYWLCNCKQTSNKPFCDGTHKNEDIQAKIRI